MGQFVNRDTENLKIYDVLDAKTFKEVYALDRLINLYCFEMQGAYKTTEVYFDTPGSLLERAGISLCKVYERKRTYFRIEKQNYVPLSSMLKVRQETVYVHECETQASIADIKLYIMDGITSMFSTSLNFDLEDIIKNLHAKLEIRTQATLVKVLRGNGFKAEMSFENVSYNNHFTKKTSNSMMVRVEMTSAKTYADSFEDFTSKLEKYCKKLIPIKDSKYQIGIKATKR